MFPAVSRFILTVWAFLLCASVQAQVDWEAAPGLADSDKAAIIELARVAGMNFPDKVTEVTSIPLNHKRYKISSAVVANGLRRTWREVYVCRTDEDACAAGDQTSVESWTLASQITRQERWRFAADTWFVDVELGTGISYAQAESIILAIRHKALVATPDLKDFAAAYDAASITAIRTLDPIAGEFEVNIKGGNGGYILHVRLQDEKVELYSVGNWVY